MRLEGRRGRLPPCQVPASTAGYWAEVSPSPVQGLLSPALLCCHTGKERDFPFPFSVQWGRAGLGRPMLRACPHIWAMSGAFLQPGMGLPIPALPYHVENGGGYSPPLLCNSKTKWGSGQPCWVTARPFGGVTPHPAVGASTWHATAPSCSSLPALLWLLNSLPKQGIEQPDWLSPAYSRLL